MRSKLTTARVVVVLAGVVFAMSFALPAIGASPLSLAKKALTKAKKANKNATAANDTANQALQKANRLVASGTAANQGSAGIGANTCALFTLGAPGVQPGDTVAITPSFTPPAGGVGTFSYDSNAVPSAGTLQVRLCAASVGYTVNDGALQVRWVAFR
jgi:hypothetical protein